MDEHKLMAIAHMILNFWTPTDPTMSVQQLKDVKVQL